MNGSELRAKFDQEWGMWRRFIAAHPLTGTWIVGGIGVAIGWFAHGVI